MISLDLLNARGGSFSRCRPGTQACTRHQASWNKHVQQHSRANLTGVRRILQRPSERLPWQPVTGERNTQPHDQLPPEEQVRKNYFSPSRFYCVETICAPCGVVIAWAKFAKSESPTNILQFMDLVYPTADSRPDYVCIDKACLVLRTVAVNPNFQSWIDTSRFIVDAYHYGNHRTTDRMYGSAPNLVIVEQDRQGRPQYKRAFNTQACEQLNAWMGGFESILKRMVPSNFNWFLHTMLFYHTSIVIQKQQQSAEDIEEDDEAQEVEEDM
ncbi:hypothetical protein FPV67DRAFT_1563606 [Lyophyllum atratum]|nr:hypothetical protein FPV67DRAFT_1563606 [Lyophyllum atratum]